MLFKQMELGPMSNWVYLFGDPESGQAAVVDPAWDVEKILATATEHSLSIEHILLTHCHPDHVNGVVELVGKTNAKVHVHEAEVDWLEGSSLPIEPSVDGTQIMVGNETVSFLHTPGHSPGSQCFVVGDRLISGDTLFINACGRTDLPGGSVEVLFHSLAKLKGLEGHLQLYPGHDYDGQSEATLGDQKQDNPFLRVASLSEFARFFQAAIY